MRNYVGGFNVRTNYENKIRISDMLIETKKLLKFYKKFKFEQHLKIGYGIRSEYTEFLKRYGASRKE